MGTGLTTTEPRGLALQTMDDAMKFGRILANSQFAPKDFQGKPESCILAIQHGAEIGLGPMQSIQSVAVINGRPAIWGDAALALVMASPVCEYVRERIDGEGDQTVAICEAKRRGYPAATVTRFTVADAKKAGLWGKSGPWTQYPRRMLQLRARGFALRDAFPDVLKGLVTAEEAQDYAAAGPAADAVAEAVDSAPSVPPRIEVKQPSPKVGWLDRVAQARTLEALALLGDDADEAESRGELTKVQRARLDAAIDKRMTALEAAVDADVGHFDAAEAAHD